MSHLQTDLTLTLATHARDDNATLLGRRGVDEGVTNSLANRVNKIQSTSEIRIFGTVYGPVHITAVVSGSCDSQNCASGFDCYSPCSDA